MSRQTMWERVRVAWAMISGRGAHDVRPGRPREAGRLPQGDEPRTSAEGFAEEALPWLDAVFRFAMRLTRGDQDAAEDLTQDTFLRALRFWSTYARGTNAKSWLFTICRNIYLQQQQLVRHQRERTEADLRGDVETLSAASTLMRSPPGPEQEFFAQLVDDAVVEAIDALPQDFHEVLVLSDLGGLRYGEIAEVMAIPLGTVKSRLFRARRLLQEQLRDLAVESGYISETST